MGFDFSFGPCSELGQKEFGLWQAELDQLGLLGNSKCENTEGCQPSLETTQELIVSRTEFLKIIGDKKVVYQITSDANSKSE